MATKKLFLGDTYLFNAKGTVLECVVDEQGTQAVLLDQTIMHPQGGGQQADMGRLSDSSKNTFVVEHVQCDQSTGKIWHKGSMLGNSPLFAIGTEVEIAVDEERRRLAARLHSAGHVLDAALEAAGRTDLVPVKGNHAPDLSFVEYTGKIDVSERSALIERMNDELKTILSNDEAVEITTGSPRPGIGPLRLVKMAGVTIPCGGTHVKSLQDIGAVTVLRIKAAKKNVKIYYTVAGHVINL